MILSSVKILIQSLTISPLPNTSLQKSTCPLPMTTCWSSINHRVSRNWAGNTQDLTKAKKPIHKVFNAGKIHKKKLESLHGYLNFCASIIFSGHTLIHSLAKLMHAKSPWVSISSQICEDLPIWLEFLDDFNGNGHVSILSHWLPTSVDPWLRQFWLLGMWGHLWRIFFFAMAIIHPKE